MPAGRVIMPLFACAFLMCALAAFAFWIDEQTTPADYLNPPSQTERAESYDLQRFYVTTGLIFLGLMLLAYIGYCVSGLAPTYATAAASEQPKRSWPASAIEVAPHTADPARDKARR